LFRGRGDHPKTGSLKVGVAFSLSISLSIRVLMMGD
jgi:hypothetical protein